MTPRSCLYQQPVPLDLPEWTYTTAAPDHGELRSASLVTSVLLWVSRSKSRPRIARTLSETPTSRCKVTASRPSPHLARQVQGSCGIPAGSGPLRSPHGRTPALHCNRGTSRLGAGGPQSRGQDRSGGPAGNHSTRGRGWTDRLGVREGFPRGRRPSRSEAEEQEKGVQKVVPAEPGAQHCCSLASGSCHTRPASPPGLGPSLWSWPRRPAARAGVLCLSCLLQGLQRCRGRSPLPSSSPSLAQ
ncbi:uncharacterized protein LOC124980860 isoform X2 [Sciurus carolinensis]|uniref:uncharacterized protein LOC124980860 isoform X2 n=1 Tax=Sciurus carolinensis TaxID=30640 RepID=UPI001FB323C3|nr:uncharacterized protein LOC124980860 isoform X2 [Sciurus carolinensis]